MPGLLLRGGTWHIDKVIYDKRFCESTSTTDTGTQLWTTNSGGTIYSGNGNVISGLAAGDGLLVVPAGNTLSAFTLSTNP